jgi:hypothetical protein
MLQESGGMPTTPIFVDREFWIGYKIFLLFLFVTCVWTAVKVARIWFRVPPFFARGQSSPDPNHLKVLQRSASSIKRWGGLVLLGWALIASMTVARTLSELPRLTIGASTVLSVVADLSASLSATLCVSLFLYLIWWHLVARIERYSI